MQSMYLASGAKSAGTWLVMMTVLVSAVSKPALDIRTLCLKPESAGIIFRISASFGLVV